MLGAMCVPIFLGCQSALWSLEFFDAFHILRSVPDPVDLSATTESLILIYRCIDKNITTPQLLGLDQQ